MSTPHTPADGMPDSRGDLTIRFEDEEITTQTLGTALVALTRLHTKLWLARAGRFDDVIAYTTIHDVRYDEQANLVIKQITMNTPVTLILAVSKILGDSIAHIIDGIGQAPLRWKEKEAETRIRQIQAERQAIELQEQKDTAPYHVEAERLELERKLLQLQQEQLGLQEARLQANLRMAALATETLTREIDQLYLDADPSARAMLVQSMLAETLQLGNFNIKAVSTDHHATHEEIVAKQERLKAEAEKRKIEPREQL